MAEASHFDRVIEMIGMVPEDAENLVHAFAPQDATKAEVMRYVSGDIDLDSAQA